MTTVGLVGGLGPESTIDYYRRIIERWQKTDPSTTPSMVIDSLDPTKALRLVASDRAAFVDYILGSIRRLEGAGVDFIAITANTPHLAFDELAAQASVPLLSIVEACANEARRRGMSNVLLLGTRFTMEADFYPTVFRRFGVAVTAPDDDERTWIHSKYVEELLEGSFTDETRGELITRIEEIRRRERIDGLVLGGTELPLLLRSPVIAGVPLLDTTELHVAAIVERLLRPSA